MSVDELIDRYEEWLSAHMTPMRDASGDVSKRRGVIQYEEMGRLKILLGAPIVDAAERMRSGDEAPYQVKRAVQELVEYWNIPQIMQLRRDQSLATSLRSGKRYADQFGHAPDGSDLQGWARRVLIRANETYGTSGVPDIEEWQDIFPTRLRNSEIRKRRMQGAA